jgi:glycosyltransferase involved in cell wall biosynthesis
VRHIRGVPDEEETSLIEHHDSGSRSRILVLDEEIPWPANTGKRLRTLNLLTILARDFALDLLVHENGASTAAIEEMRRRGIAVRISPSRIPDKSGLLLPARIAASLAARLPYSVYSHYRAGYRRTLRGLIRSERYDLVHCEWTPYAIYARRLASPVCIAAHNVEWHIWDRMASTASNPLQRAVYRLQAALMRRFEREVFTAFKHATVVSDGDGEAIRAFGCRDVVVVPNGVDGDAYQPPSAGAAEPRSLVFSGSMDWRANQDAIRWFIDAVHPRLRERGAYKLYVVGRTPPPWLTDPTRVPPELVVTGTVDDVRPWIARGSVYVVPLRVGGGSRLKILEALAMGQAVVSTTVGAEGLDLEAGRHFVAADTPEDFAEAVSGLLDDPVRRRALGAAGRALIDARYRWEQIAPLQGALWRRAIEGSGRA